MGEERTDLWERWKYDQSFRRVMSEAWEGLFPDDRIEILRNRGMSTSLVDLPLSSICAEGKRYSPNVMGWLLEDIGKKAHTMEAQLEEEISEVREAGAILDEARYEGKKCDFCDRPAEYDGKTRDGPWAYMCERDFKIHGIGLGTGMGQRLIQKAPREKAIPIKEIKTVGMTESNLEEAELEGLWHPKCPYCGERTPAEVDAEGVSCRSCNQYFNIDNPCC